MSLKLKIFSLSLAAAVTASAFSVMNASALTNGHFTHEGPTNHATIVGTENGIHSAHSLSLQGTEPTGTFGGAGIVCATASYTGEMVAKTVTSLTVTPTYSSCVTTGTAANVTVTTNGCSYTFFSNSAASTLPPTSHATVRVNCPIGQKLLIHHPNCTISIPAQLLRGATYATTVEGKHALTVNMTITHIAGQYHEGICIFLGTNHEFDMTGSVTVKGLDTAGNQIAITAK